MAYSTSNLSLWQQTVEGSMKEWIYITSDTVNTVLGTGYITDGAKKRMGIGDLVWVMSGTLNQAAAPAFGPGYPETVGFGGTFTAAPTWQACLVSAINATTGAATLVAAALPASAAIANFRNLIDGGDFTINPWQRGTSFTGINSTVTYTADRFFAVGGASSSISVSQVANTTIAGFAQSLVFGRAAANTNTAQISLGQVLETGDCYRMQGQQMTLSFWAAAGANFSAAGSALNVQLISGTGSNQSAASMVAGTWSGQVNVVNAVAAASAAQPITTGLVRYSFTGTVPAGSTQLGILFSYQPVGTAGAQDNVILEGIQLEAGSQPTAFEHRDVQVELEICQRYCWVVNEPAANVIVGTGMNTTSAIQVFYLATPVQLRVPPAVTVSAGTFKTNQSGAPTSTTITPGSTHTVNAISINGNSAGTAGQGTLLQGGGGAGLITASADL